MKLHANAALSLNQRRRMVGRVVDQGWSLTKAAEAAEVSERTDPWTPVPTIGCRRTELCNRVVYLNKPHLGRKPGPKHDPRPTPSVCVPLAPGL